MAISNLTNLGYGDMDQGTLQKVIQALAPQWQQGGEQGGFFSPVNQATNINGYNYIPDGQGGYYQFKDNSAYDNGKDIQNYNGSQVSHYGSTGKYDGSGVMSGINKNSFMGDYGPFISVLPGFAQTISGVANAGMAASLAAENSFDTGAMQSILNSAPDAAANTLSNTTSQLTNPFLGENMASGVTNWDAAAGQAGLNLTTPGIETVAPSTFNAATDSQLANEQLNLGPNTDPVSPAIPTTDGVPPGYTPPPPVPPGGGTPPIPKVPVVPGGGGGGGGGPGGGGGDFNWGSLIPLLGGLYDMNRQEKYQQQMLDYLKGRQTMNDNLYAPGSPELQLMQQQMDAKDAAAGRNSQYGTRAVNLAGQIAKIKADANTQMTTGIANVYSNAINKQAGADSGLLAAIGALSGGKGGTGGIPDWMTQFGKSMTSGNWDWLKNAGNSFKDWSPDTTTPSVSDNFQPEGGDQGQYL